MFDDQNLRHNPFETTTNAPLESASIAQSETRNGDLVKLLPLLETALGDWELGGVVPQEGQLPGRRYSLRLPYAVGGQGVVLLGVDELNGNIVAFKTVNLHRIADKEIPQVVKRMDREINVQGQHRDRHILPILGAGRLSYLNLEIPYFITRFVFGRSLAKKLAKWTTLPQFEVVRILRELAIALKSLHQREAQSGAIDPICHRDIKPDNVLLETWFLSSEKCEAVILADLGLVRSTSMEDAGTVGQGPGTENYMAYERLDPPAGEGNSPQPPSDIFSLGCVAYQMLVGRPPFDRFQEILRQKPPDEPRKLRSAIQPVLSALVMNMLSHDPKVRPTVDAIVHEIDSWKNTEASWDLDQNRPSEWPTVPNTWPQELDELLVLSFGFPEAWLQLFQLQQGRLNLRSGILVLLRSLIAVRKRFEAAEANLVICAATLYPTWLDTREEASGSKATGTTDDRAWRGALKEARATIRQEIIGFFEDVKPYWDVFKIIEFGQAYQLISADLEVLLEVTGVGLGDVSWSFDVDGNKKPGQSDADDDDEPSVAMLVCTVYESLQRTITRLLVHHLSLVDLQVATKDYLLAELAASNSVRNDP